MRAPSSLLGGAPLRLKAPGPALQGHGGAMQTLLFTATLHAAGESEGGQRRVAFKQLMQARSARTTFASRSVLASTLNAIVQTRVTLSLL